jgi:hypothetical protein
LRWQGDYAAGKNKIINGDFGIWQRGTSFQPNGTAGFYCADRFIYLMDDGTNNKTVSQQTFTPGTAPVSGYEGTYFLRVASTAASTTETYSFLSQYIEDVRTFAGQTITISFWAKAAANTTMPSVAIRQSFGSGGSGAVDTTVTTSIAVTTSWQRFSYSVAVPSVSGKTIGTSSYLRIGLFNPTRATFTLDFWGVQVEAGSVATAFQTATGTIQGELSACQRYYAKSYNQVSTVPTNGSGSYTFTPYPANAGNGETFAYVPLPVVMRGAPSVTVYSFTSSSTGRVSGASGGDLAANSGTAANISDRGFAVYNNSGGTINQASGGFIFHWAASGEL